MPFKDGRMIMFRILGLLLLFSIVLTSNSKNDFDQSKNDTMNYHNLHFKNNLKVSIFESFTSPAASSSQ